MNYHVLPLLLARFNKAPLSRRQRVYKNKKTHEMRANILLTLSEAPSIVHIHNTTEVRS
jgi:hypothetical protein